MPFDAICPIRLLICDTPPAAPARLALVNPHCDTCTRPTPGLNDGDHCPFMNQIDGSSPCPGHVIMDFVPDDPAQ